LLRAFVLPRPSFSPIAGFTVIYHGRVLHLGRSADMMTNRWLVSILCGGVSSIVLSACNTTSHRDCGGLTSLSLPDIKIGEAVGVLAATSGDIRRPTAASPA
jgi:hypothetical protein